MPRHKQTIGKHKDGMVDQIWTDTYHYKVTMSGGTVFHFDEQALIATGRDIAGMPYVVSGIADGGHGMVGMEVWDVVCQWYSASDEERTALICMGITVERGKFESSYEMKMDYS